MPPVSLSYCAEQVRRFDGDRFVCMLFAPPAEREALAALYAFNLAVARIREQVREPLLGQMRLQWWRDTITAIYDRRPTPRQPVAEALAGVIGTYALDRALFERLLTARERDLEDAPPATLEALVAYADATSGALALLALRILGTADDEEAARAGRACGVAWALTGLLRSVPHHAAARRLFLPVDLMRDAGLDPQALFARGATAGLGTVAAAIGLSARRHLALARSVRRGRWVRPSLPVLLQATLAGGFLRRLERAGFDPFTAGIDRRDGRQMLALLANRALGRY